MTSSLAAPDISLPLISNLNSLIALSSLRYSSCELTMGTSGEDVFSRALIDYTGDDTKLEATRSDLGIANTLGSGGANSQLLSPSPRDLTSAHFRPATPGKIALSNLPYPAEG